jgi:hypothetical protein
VKVFGSSQNLASFSEHVFKVLEKANMDYERALDFVEVYLGKVFKIKKSPAYVYQIYDPGIDTCRSLFGEAAVKARLNSMVYKLSCLMQKYYLPRGSTGWDEMERMLGDKFDFNEYYSRSARDKYCPAEEAAALLFESAIRGTGEFTMPYVMKFTYRYIKELGEAAMVPIRVKRQKVGINYHLWRKWIYSLWGQAYEWGCYTIDEKTAVANGKHYLYQAPPRYINRLSTGIFSFSSFLSSMMSCRLSRPSRWMAVERGHKPRVL